MIIILFFTVLLLLFFFIFYPHNLKTTSLEIKNQNFQIEVATTIKQRSQGLMYRTSLCPNCGMIFIFEFEMPLSFWMKNTLIPLDIIFIDKNGIVTNISSGIPQSLDLIKSLKPAKYVIELNAGTSNKIGLITGDIISIPNEIN